MYPALWLYSRHLDRERPELDEINKIKTSFGLLLITCSKHTCLYFDSLRHSYLICDVTNLIISSKTFKCIFEQKSFSCLTRTEKVPINEVLQDFVTLKYKTNMQRITAVGSPKGGKIGVFVIKHIVKTQVVQQKF